ncbi:hypothetical protein SASPL_116010 [Salvia splendens]|uniref:Uncharacterized protein n=1 Tax=Salvia splendens TaxID=180675 RepID=A0A8X8Y640_SALSN|nr:hypothetical protein SASPL_116010 [Salvia splendens]
MPLIMHSPKLQRLGTVDHSSSSRLRVYQVWKGKNVCVFFMCISPIYCRSKAIIVLLFLTSGSDPGIIPRNSQPPDPDDDSSGDSHEQAPMYPVHGCPTVTHCGDAHRTTYENFRYQYDRKMNPYNVGTFRNRMEVFCSRKPRSRNDFRALVRNDSLVNSYTGATSDLELGRRRGFDAGDFEDPRNRMGHLGRLERCRTQPRHDHWEERRGNWR